MVRPLERAPSQLLRVRLENRCALGFVWCLAVIQALDVDRAEPWPDGQDREEDQALLV
jgi:hypothetical protein